MRNKITIPEKYPVELVPVYKILEGYHDIYIKAVSVDYMAASLEVCKMLMYLCYSQKVEVEHPAIPNKMINRDVISVLDMGSGVSTFALYLYKQEVNPNLYIMSVDTDFEFISKTKNFIKSKLGMGNYLDDFTFWYGPSIVDRVCTPFDLIFLDIEGTPLRGYFLKQLFDLGFIQHNTLVLCDDMHKLKFDEMLSNCDYEKLDLKEYTIDKIGRWSELFYNFRAKEEKK